MSDGTKLTGTYGTWQGREWELDGSAPYNGKLTLIRDGGEQPGPDWKQMVYPNRFARTPLHFRKDVDAGEVSDVHSIKATAMLDQHQVLVIAEDDGERLAVQTVEQMASETIRRFIDQFGFEPYENAVVFGWVEPHALRDLNIERTERVHTASSRSEQAA